MPWPARSVTAIAGLATLLVGCGHVIDGAATPAARAVRILPTDEEITAAVGNGLSTYDFRPFVGGLEILPDGYRTDANASPIACIGVTDTTVRVVYEATPLVEAARQSYFTLERAVGVSGADAAVVRMASAADAQRVFDDFVRQWQDCDGRTIDKHLGGAENRQVFVDVSDVVAQGELLSATLHTRPGPSDSPAHYQRVVGVRGETIVEVSLAITPNGERDLVPRAAAVAEAMLGKL